MNNTTKYGRVWACDYDERISVQETGRDYDFIAIIENTAGRDITIESNVDDFYPVRISAGDWMGLLADDNGRATLDALKEGRYSVLT